MKSNIYLRILSTILFMALILSCFVIVSCSDGSRGLEYRVNSDGKTCTVTGLGTYSSKYLIIPNNIDGYKVTEIAEYAFQGTDIETFSGADSITTIGKYAFQNCKQLRTVVIPNSVTEIGEHCFEYCESLHTVDLSSNLKTINSHTFAECKSIEMIQLPEGIVIIDEKAFYFCELLKSINIPNTAREIGKMAFWSCQSLQSITIPDSVTTIGGSAFGVCYSLTEFYIPTSVIDIGVSPLFANELVEIKVDENHSFLSSINGDLYYKNNTVFVNYACGKLDTSLIIPTGVREICALSLGGALNLTTIYIPSTIKSIGSGIFHASPNIEVLYYDSTVEDWKKILKAPDWNENTESVFTIVCADGTIAMDGTVTYN